MNNDPWIICRVCEGDGKVVNPNIDAGGLSEDKFTDPDFTSNYMTGVYDIDCAACTGSGKIRQSRLEELRQNAEDRRAAAREDGNYESYRTAGDFRYG